VGITYELRSPTILPPPDPFALAMAESCRSLEQRTTSPGLNELGQLWVEILREPGAIPSAGFRVNASHERHSLASRDRFGVVPPARARAPLTTHRADAAPYE
jgi:hypothetical protein